MQGQLDRYPVSLALAARHRSDADTERTYHLPAEHPERRVTHAGLTTRRLSETQADEFAARFSTEDETECRVSKRL